jgi:predicted RNA-binding protein with TRAM domain
MTTEKMTVHKALAELKVIGDRITNAISTGVYCRANKHSNEKIGGVSVEDFKKQIQGSWDKANDLIKRRNAIKKAVVFSNATTKVKIGENEMTVAEAIEMKNSGMQFKKVLLSVLNNQYTQAVQVTDRENGDTLQQKAESYVIGLFGSKEGKTSSDEIEKVKREFITNNTFELIDPIKVKEKMETLEKEIVEFESEIDAALSVSNAITEINIEY